MNARTNENDSPLSKHFRAARRRLLRRMACAWSRSWREPGSVLVVAPHPDDEVLGCGGLLASLAKRGGRVDLLFLTSGGGSHLGCCGLTKEVVGQERMRLALLASRLLSIPEECLHWMGAEDGCLPISPKEGGFAEQVSKLAKHLEAIRPEAVLCPHPLEGWRDHEAAEALTREAVERLSFKAELFHYCVWFWYSIPLYQAWRVRWREAYVLDIRDNLPVKKKAMKIYLEAIAPCGNPWAGRLPQEFLRAFDWHRELFFAVPLGVKAYSRPCDTKK